MNRRLILQRIARVVERRGFRRQGTRWHRLSGELTDVVALTVSKSGDSINVELGVFDPEPYGQLLPDSPKTVTEADCVVRLRLSELRPNLASWQGTPPDIDEVLKLLEEQGLPWLDSMAARGARITFVRNRPYVLIPFEAALLALTELAAGEKGAAEERLLDLQDRAVGPWRDRVAEILGIVRSAS